MGYFKNPEESQKVFDSEGFLHSGDMGKINKDNVLFITGRVKELIITAGGENIPPVLIENEIKAAMPFLSNVMVVGEGKKYLNCLITLKEDPPNSGKLEINCKQFLQSKGCDVSTVKEAISHPHIGKIILEGLEIANNKAISRAQRVQNYHILSEDFSVENGALTPTLKLKRKEVSKRYANEIENTYLTAKL